MESTSNLFDSLTTDEEESLKRLKRSLMAQLERVNKTLNNSEQMSEKHEETAGKEMPEEGIKGHAVEDKMGEKAKRSAEVTKPFEETEAKNESSLPVKKAEGNVIPEDCISLDLEEEERILEFPKIFETGALGFYESCINKSKSKSEYEATLKKAEKKPTNPWKIAYHEIKAAETNILSKKDEAIPPEGKKKNPFAESTSEKKKVKITVAKDSLLETHGSHLQIQFGVK
ncbi:hypothetical protein niasHS_003224 [Heterodera schachtii]|uniref:Uncharacterized protein n=1 Tax=Heterodera schachtii TaxID=97005 RepID=A0ABD2KGN0_HETSC